MASKKKAERTFLFYEHTGELVNYPQGADYVEKTKDQARYVGELTYHHYSRGRSSALLVFTDGVEIELKRTDGSVWQTRPREYEFFMSTADELFPRMVHGKINGVFVPSKRGGNTAWMLDDTPCSNCNHTQLAHLPDGKCLFGPTTFAVRSK